MNRKIKIIEDNIFGELVGRKTGAELLIGYSKNKKFTFQGKKVFYRKRTKGNKTYIEFVIGSSGIV